MGLDRKGTEWELLLPLPAVTGATAIHSICRKAVEAMTMAEAFIGISAGKSFLFSGYFTRTVGIN
jgi:hypothetical protein